MEKIKIDILPNIYLKDDKTFDLDKSIQLCGKIAGVCYDKEGFSHLENEPLEKTMRRVKMTLENGHHSVYDHIYISFNIQNIPKILAMILNNEHQYTTSEKSARYTPIIRKEGSNITAKEARLYNKWIDIFKIEIENKYKDIYQDNKILKLAQENARYLVTVFMPTQMIYTTSLRQINYIVSWMKKYIKDINNNDFNLKISNSMQEFINELDRLNVLEPCLLRNEKERSLSLFGTNLDKLEEYFGHIYATTYKCSFAELAQTQRHRTIDYKMELLNEKEYFIPPIIKDNPKLAQAWLIDMNKVKDVYPQGELILIHETGKYEDFILKCKERLCTSAQLEIMNQTQMTLKKYEVSLREKESPLLESLLSYSKGARCTFKDFTCTLDCHFKEGKLLTRQI